MSSILNATITGLQTAGDSTSSGTLALQANNTTVMTVSSVTGINFTTSNVTTNTGTLISTVTALPGAVTGTPSSTTYLRGDGTWATVTAGVSQIIAGTNITISPSGGTGNVTINATGGFTQAKSMAISHTIGF